MRVALLAAFPLHVIPGFESEQPAGHYATWLPQLSAAFARNPEFELHWLLVSRRIAHQEPIAWNGQTFHLLHIPEKLRALRGYRRDCALIHAKLDALQPQLVHAWGTEDCYGLAAARSRRLFLLSMQGILSAYAQRSRMHPLEYLQTAIELFIFLKARHVSSESTWGCELIRRRAPRAKVYQVEYGVPELYFHTPWQPDPAKPVAIFIGSASPRKGIQDAVAAFSRPELRFAELWIVGDRDSRFARELQSKSAANVRWLGRKTREEAAALLARAWCLVLPTRADTSPNVVKEARVIGLPVVTTRHGGQADYIFDDQTGWLVEPGDLPALADRLVRVLGDFAAARRLGACRHEEQRAWFRPENTAEGFLKIYRELGAQL